jgi:DNA-binding MarR family transcriptional regulator
MNNREQPRIAPSLEHATHALGLWVERTFSDIGLSQAEAHVLAYLARRPPGEHAPIATINDLHTSFGHKRSTLTSLLDRLEGRGWVRRARHSTSRRLVAIELTNAGRSVGERVGAALGAVEDRVRARAGEAALADFFAVVQLLEEEI